MRDVVTIAIHGVFQVDAIREKIGYPDFILNNTELEAEYAGVLCPHVMNINVIYYCSFYERHEIIKSVGRKITFYRFIYLINQTKDPQVSDTSQHLLDKVIKTYEQIHCES